MLHSITQLSIKYRLQYQISPDKLCVYSLHLISDGQLFMVEAILYCTQFLINSFLANKQVTFFLYI